MTYEEWVKRNFGDLRLLGASTFQYKPGVILDDHGQRIATAWSVLGESSDDPFWKTEQGAGLLSDHQFTEERTAGVTLKIPGLVAITFNSGGKVRASFTAREVQLRSFESATQQTVDARLRTLKVPHSMVWKDFIDGHLVVLETWYATKVDIQFHREGNVIARAEVEKTATISAGLDRTWTEDHTLTVTSDGKVPFAVRGWRP